MRLIMGVDGGGSKTYTVIVDEAGNKLGSGVSGCGNHQVNGIDETIRNIRESMEIALKEADLQASDIDFVQYGLAGADREKDFAILRPALGCLPIPNWDVVCDTMEGLRTGSKDNIGVILVCGSGTNAAGRNPSGQTVQTGGFGYLYGDAAGGGHMASETFRAAVRSWEYREIPSILPDMVAQFLGFSDFEQTLNHYLDHELYSVPRNVTIVLHEAADKGDLLAIQLLETTGKELGIAANSVIRRLGGFDGVTIPIVLVGSVLQKGKNPHLLNALKRTVEKENPHFELILPEMAPVYGSILLGMDHLGIDAPQAVYDKFIQYGGYDQ
ncbi:N-acetylglucosamine kinase [Paenibacillus thermotolerans]|uniref:N-acetylglucosamine kinase n=1 Tax=Paenibacillus thermotolerans TaxID=3027807 RepID=UPI002367D5E2|nr:MULTISPECIES: BadF/BadG/BcrA/BcrD ATPase family protein [unclassified Paenibacillus]